MATLKLIDLYCIETEDSLGADEPYLLVDGSKKWSGSLNNGEHAPMVDKQGNPLEFTFNGAIDIKLYDSDGNHWYDRDDFLGSFRVTELDVVGGNPMHFTLDGANYELSYTVTP
jgi:hypothetical protein